MLEAAASGDGVLVIVHQVFHIVAAAQCFEGEAGRRGKLSVFLGGFRGACAHQQEDRAAEDDRSYGEDPHNGTDAVGDQDLPFQLVAGFSLFGCGFVLLGGYSRFLGCFPDVELWQFLCRFFR